MKTLHLYFFHVRKVILINK